MRSLSRMVSKLFALNFLGAGDVRRSGFSFEFLERREIVRNPVKLGGFSAGRRWMTIVAMLAIGSVLLAACGGDDDEEETPTPQPAVSTPTPRRPNHRRSNRPKRNRRKRLP